MTKMSQAFRFLRDPTNYNDDATIEALEQLQAVFPECDLAIDEIILELDYYRKTVTYLKRKLKTTPDDESPSFRELYNYLIQKKARAKQIPHIFHLVEVGILSLASQAHVDRCFSSMKRVKCNLRTSLHQSTLNALMSVLLNKEFIYNRERLTDLSKNYHQS